jgi:hypothetical protein
MNAPALSLFVECHAFVCSLSTEAIERLVLPHEVTPLASSGAVPLVQVGGRTYASFNLGRLLRLPPTTGASVLVRARFAGAEIPLCFETGPCLVVQRPEVSTPLTGGLFNANRRAFQGAFSLPLSMRMAGRSPVGLALDIEELASATERESAATSLRMASPPAGHAP